jgi:phosphoserine phosphatase
MGTPGVQEVVKMLHKQDTAVYLVSGGFQNMLKPVALELHIPQNKIYANEILFDADGKYAGFDRSAPTSASGGKPKVLKMMQKKHKYKTMIMFGDGATDMDARTSGPASAFVGYGGVTVRQKIKAGADWFITDFQEILDVLPRGSDL